MKTSRFLGVLFGFVAAVFLLSSVSSAWAQANSYTKIIAKGKKAYSIPISDKTVKFEVTLPSGKLAKLLVKEGGMAKIGNLDEGYAFALVPVITDMAKKSASFTILRLTQDEDGNESIRQLERVDASLEAPISTKTEPPFQIRLVSIEEPSGLVGEQIDNKMRFPAVLAQAEADPKKNCCVICPEIWACGLCVWLECGCCCDPPKSCLVL